MRQIVRTALLLLIAWPLCRFAIRPDGEANRGESFSLDFSSENAMASSFGGSADLSLPDVAPANGVGCTSVPGSGPAQVTFAGVVDRNIAVGQEKAADGYGSDGRQPIVHSRPNPFVSSTEIAFTLPHASHANLRLYDSHGREVALLMDEYREEGTYLVTLDGTGLAAGTYSCVLETSTGTASKGIVLSK